GWGHKRWAIHFLCGFSSYQWVRMLTTKENLIATVEEWLDFIKNQTSLQPQTIHSDGFREIIDSLEVLCAGRGISLSITAPYTPAANGKIEKAGRTFNDQG